MSIQIKNILPAQQEKTMTAGTSKKTVKPDSGKLLSKVVVKPTPSQSKTVRVTDKVQIITPDSGKLLKQIIVEPKEIKTTVVNLLSDEHKIYKTYYKALSIGNLYFSDTTVAPNGSSTSIKLDNTDNTSSETTIAVGFKPYLIPSHKYYFSVFLYQRNITNSSFDCYWPIAEPPIISGVKVSTINTWTKHSTIFTRESFTEGEQYFRVDCNNPTAEYLYINGMILVDLTAAFSAGYEPNKEWCDANIIYTTNNTEQPVTYSLP